MYIYTAYVDNHTYKNEKYTRVYVNMYRTCIVCTYIIYNLLNDL